MNNKVAIKLALLSCTISMFLAQENDLQFANLICKLGSNFGFENESSKWVPGPQVSWTQTLIKIHPSCCSQLKRSSFVFLQSLILLYSIIKHKSKVYGPYSTSCGHMKIDSLVNQLSTFLESRSCAYSTSKPVCFLNAYCPLIIEGEVTL